MLRRNNKQLKLQLIILHMKSNEMFTSRDPTRDIPRGLWFITPLISDGVALFTPEIPIHCECEFTHVEKRIPQNWVFEMFRFQIGDRKTILRVCYRIRRKKSLWCEQALARPWPLQTDGMKWCDSVCVNTPNSQTFYPVLFIRFNNRSGHE